MTSAAKRNFVSRYYGFAVHTENLRPPDQVMSRGPNDELWLPDRR